jgi:energy-converting hydrogenase Eha subunit A
MRTKTTQIILYAAITAALVVVVLKLLGQENPVAIAGGVAGALSAL